MFQPGVGAFLTNIFTFIPGVGVLLPEISIFPPSRGPVPSQGPGGILTTCRQIPHTARQKIKGQAEKSI